MAAPRKKATPAPDTAPTVSGPGSAPAPDKPADPVVLSKSVDGDEPDPKGEVRLAPKPAPPHPIKRYRVAPAAHLGTRVGGFVLTERGWVPATPEQES